MDWQTRLKQAQPVGTNPPTKTAAELGWTKPPQHPPVAQEWPNLSSVGITDELECETPEQISKEISNIYRSVVIGRITSSEGKRRCDILTAKREVLELVELANEMREVRKLEARRNGEFSE